MVYLHINLKKVIERLHKTKKTCRSLRGIKITSVFESSSPL